MDRIALAADRAAVVRCGIARGDRAPQATVRTALRRDPVLRPFRDTFAVGVHDGVAALYGRVKSPAQARIAESRAAAVPGVLAVRNGLVVDEVLKARVAGALRDDPQTRDAIVTVDSWRGSVALIGKVPTQAGKQRATEVAPGVPGVCEVRNYLVVDPTPPPFWFR